MKKWLHIFCLGLFAGCGTLILNGCEATVHGGGEVYYDYDYYPARNVYFYPDRRVYYWNDAGRWRSGRTLPSQFDIHEEHSEHLRLHSKQPWTEHHSDHDDHDHDHH